MVLRLLLALLVAVLAPGEISARQEPWPPAGVFTVKDAVTPPKLVSQLQPTYTREAARRRIQGFVTLQFVIELDGTVGPVRILRSLDAESGLDAAAIETLKRWRFTTAMKDGTPVRFMASAMLAYTLRDAPPPLSWPAGFDVAADDTRTWRAGERVDGGIRLQFQYPQGWSRARDSGPVLAVDPRTSRSFGTYPPRLSPRELPFPMPVLELQRFSEWMSRQFGSRAEVLAVGQQTHASINWLWLELDLVDEARAWAFATVFDSQLVQVMCTAITPRVRMTEAERDAEIASARLDCAQVLKRITFSKQ